MNYKYLYMVFVLFLALTSCNNIISSDAGKFDLKFVPKYDIYQDNIIRSSHKKQAGQKEGNRILDDQVEISVYVPDYSSEKGKAICNFYKEYYKTLSNKVERHLIVEVNLYNSKNNINTVSSKEKDVSYKGGMTYNYNNNECDEKILN